MSENATELRHDPILDQWTLIAPGRRARPRPHRHEPATPAAPDPACPFCPGNEDQTPPETAALREGGEGSKGNGPGWRARCFPNKYPATSPGPARERGEAPFRAMAGGGGHEVLVDSPDHTRGLADLPDRHAAAVLLLLQRRVRAFFAEPATRAVAVFKNHGALAGASVAHSHLQVLALPVLPPMTRRRRAAEARALREGGAPLLDQLMAREYEEKARLIETGAEGAVAVCPWASRLPYLVRIAPWPPETAFAASPPAALAAVGGALARTLRRMKALLGDPPLNVYFHLEARGEEGEKEAPPQAHAWWIEVFPRLTGLAGLEAGAGIHINEVAPEQAAADLRGAAFRE